MSLEIERKFLVANEGWKTAVIRSVRLRDGLIAMGEIELADAGQEFALPDWIGAEVTSDPRYRKVNMLADRVANQKSADTALLARADEGDRVGAFAAARYDAIGTCAT
jgi:CYTH domain-containing protein